MHVARGIKALMGTGWGEGGAGREGGREEGKVSGVGLPCDSCASNFF